MVLTGAPCAGKTSALDYIEGLFKHQGFQVYRVDEVATQFLRGKPVDLSDPGTQVRFQASLLRAQLQAEDNACAAASFDPAPSIVLCDSGAPSGMAYCSDVQWQQVLNTIGVTSDELAGRYSLALRLGSLAELGDGSRYDFGPGSSNPARYHTGEQARLLAPRLAHAYALCRQLHVPAQESWNLKLELIGERIREAQRYGWLPAAPHQDGAFQFDARSDVPACLPGLVVLISPREAS